MRRRPVLTALPNVLIQIVDGTWSIEARLQVLPENKDGQDEENRENGRIDSGKSESKTARDVLAFRQKALGIYVKAPEPGERDYSCRVSSRVRWRLAEDCLDPA